MAVAAEARRLASPALHTLARRRVAELGALALALAALALLVALVSYHPGDPSLDTASAGPVANLAGRPGAVAADLLLQGVRRRRRAARAGAARLGVADRLASRPEQPDAATGRAAGGAAGDRRGAGGDPGLARTAARAGRPAPGWAVPPAGWPARRRSMPGAACSARSA